MNDPYTDEELVRLRERAGVGHTARWLARLDLERAAYEVQSEVLAVAVERAEAAEAKRDRLAAENRALREAVGVVPEWIYGLNRKSPSHNSEWYCLFCSVSRTEHGHHPACPRQAALAPKEEDGTHG